MLIAWLLAGSVAGWVGSIDMARSATGSLHLRPLDSLATTAIASGLDRSPTFAELVRAVEDSPFVVYVESSRTLKGGMQGCLVHGGGGPGFMRVRLKVGLSLDERVDVLAHELQHVREVIQAGILNDAAAMDALFSRIGHNRRQRGGRQQEYETDAARQIAALVTRELRANRHGLPQSR